MSAPVPRSEDAERFREIIAHHLNTGGRDGFEYAIDHLFEITDLVLDNRYCATHTMSQIRRILNRTIEQNESSDEEMSDDEGSTAASENDTTETTQYNNGQRGTWNGQTGYLFGKPNWCFQADNDPDGFYPDINLARFQPQP